MPSPIALAGVGVTLYPLNAYNPPGQPNLSYPVLNFGNASDTQDTYGIPLPPPGDLGIFPQGVIFFIEIQKPIDGNEYRYDPTPRAANPVAPDGTIKITVMDTGAVLTTPPATALQLQVHGQ